jgi:hypothetical protein
MLELATQNRWYSPRRTKSRQKNCPGLCSCITLSRRTCLGQLLGDMYGGSECVLVCSCCQTEQRYGRRCILVPTVAPVCDSVVLWKLMHIYAVGIGGRSERGSRWVGVRHWCDTNDVAAGMASRSQEACIVRGRWRRGRITETKVCSECPVVRVISHEENTFPGLCVWAGICGSPERRWQKAED